MKHLVDQRVRIHHIDRLPRQVWRLIRRLALLGSVLLRRALGRRALLNLSRCSNRRIIKTGQRPLTANSWHAWYYGGTLNGRTKQGKVYRIGHSPQRPRLRTPPSHRLERAVFPVKTHAFRASFSLTLPRCVFRLNYVAFLPRVARAPTMPHDGVAVVGRGIANRGCDLVVFKKLGFGASNERRSRHTGIFGTIAGA